MRTGAGALSRPWDALHRLEVGSPLLDETPEGDVLLDLTRFDELVPTPRTAGSPYGEE